MEAKRATPTAAEQVLRLAALRRELAALEADVGRADPGTTRASVAPPELASLALVAELTPGLVTVLDPRGEFLYVPPHSASLVGWAPDELVGRLESELVHPEDAARVVEERAAPSVSGIATSRYRLRTRDGAWRLVETRSRPLVDAGGVVRTLSVTRGIDEEDARRIEELELIANQDALTSIANRRAAQATLEREIGRSRRHGFAVSVVLFDVDYFKALNDRYGHATGDRVLVSVAGALRSGLRREDFVARWGGEEFVAILPHTKLADAICCAERLRVAIEDLEASLPLVTVSAGVAQLGEEDDKALLRRADDALYRAKARGRNRIAAHADSISV